MRPGSQYAACEHENEGQYFEDFLCAGKHAHLFQDDDIARHALQALRAAGWERSGVVSGASPQGRHGTWEGAVLALMTSFYKMVSGDKSKRATLDT